MKFRRKTFEIEAVQFTAIDKGDPCFATEPPQWLLDAVERGDVRVSFGRLFVYSGVGPLPASPGDWIVRTMRGHIVPCNPQIFAEDYVPADETPFDLVAHLTRQREFSARTFGPGPRTAGVVDHIRKELNEIMADPADVEEWVDVVILAFDGAWRAGWEPADIVKAIVAKQTKNEGRTWPDWRTMREDQAIEHDRSADGGA